MNDSPLESYVLPVWAQAKGLTHCFIYHGASMYPIFKNGDFLYLRSPLKQLRKGDIIVFYNPEISGYAVHRIMAGSGLGFITRGDHNPFIDEMVVMPDQIVGKVEFLKKKAQISRVANGLWGFWLAGFLQFVLLVDRGIKQVLLLPYNLIREKQIVAHFWRPKIIRLKVQSGNAQQIKYIYNNATVAVWEPDKNKFECRKPFNLVIPSPMNHKHSI